MVACIPEWVRLLSGLVCWFCSAKARVRSQHCLYAYIVLFSRSPNELFITIMIIMPLYFFFLGKTLGVLTVFAGFVVFWFKDGHMLECSIR